MTTALIVEDDRNTIDALARIVEREGFDVAKATSLADARRAISSNIPDVVLCDIHLPDGTGTALLAELEDEPLVDVIVVTGNASIESAVEALRFGACDYLEKPVDVARLRTLLAHLKRSRRLREEVASLRNELRQLGRFGPLVGTSPAMQKVYDLIEKVAPTDATVLVNGASGTGKELVAAAIHDMSPRRQGPMVPVNCGAISPNLIESELFGHEKGSFTGASSQHAGFFEQASGGTLFLDEITEMPIELQVKLLRVLETGTITRVGGKRTIPVDVRIVAASNRNVEQAVRDGKLREDLYYRLKVFPIKLPPLKDRGQDIEGLAIHFLAEANRKNGRDVHFSDEAIEKIRNFSWPGNVRELRHAIERAFIVAGDTIEAGDLPFDGEGSPLANREPVGPSVTVAVGTSIEEAERRLIIATLEHEGGDKKRAAEVLGVSLKTLYNRLNKYERDGQPEPEE